MSKLEVAAVAKLSNIGGIGEIFSNKLKACNVHTQETLLEKGSTEAGRRALIRASGIRDELVRKWVKRADLARISDIGEDCADLLEMAGVESVAELAQCNATFLCTTMAQINEERSLVRFQPQIGKVKHWIEQAKDLERAVLCCVSDVGNTELAH